MNVEATGLVHVACGEDRAVGFQKTAKPLNDSEVVRVQFFVYLTFFNFIKHSIFYLNGSYRLTKTPI